MPRPIHRAATVAAVTAASLAGALAAAAPGHAGPDVDPAYAHGRTVFMHGAHLDTAAPDALLAGPTLYILGFPEPAGTTGAVTLPSGYQPQCDPCPQEPSAYHDHLLSAVPGDPGYRGVFRIVRMVYSPDYMARPDFRPVTSTDGLAEAERAHEFAPIASGAADPYELPTGSVLVTPVVGAP